MFKKLINNILSDGNGYPTVLEWIAGFAVIALLRSFFEVYSTSSHTGFLVSDSQRVHYFLFYVAIAFMLTLAVSLFTKQKNNRVLNLALYGLPIIFLAPMIDLFLSIGKGVNMDYLFDSPNRLFYNFFTFFGPLNGITYGIRIEIFVILCAIGWYVWMKGRNFISAIGAFVVSYALIFLVCALPEVLSLSTLNISDSSAAVSSWSFTEKSITSSGISSNILHSTLLYGSHSRLVTLGIASLFSQIFFLLSFISGLILFWYTSRETLTKVLRNARPERILFYLSFLFLGVWMAHKLFSTTPTWADWVGLIVLAVSWLSAWMFAVHTNDIADVEIDKVSSPERPLANNSLSPQTMREIGYIWLIVSFVGAYIVGYYPFFMMTIFTSAYYVYSAKPLRLKQVPILSSFLISIAVLSTILAGFYFASPDKMISAFPSSYVFGIVLLLTLGVNIRDIKDTDGDRKAGIQTLPIIFGKYGKIVVGALFALSIILAPFFFPFFTTYSIAIPTAFIGFWLCIREQYKERYIFILFFVFVLVSIFLQ